MNVAYVDTLGMDASASRSSDRQIITVPRHLDLDALFSRRWMTRSVMDGSGLMKILSTSGPFLCRATIDLRKRDDDKLWAVSYIFPCYKLATYLFSYEMSLPSSETYESSAVDLNVSSVARVAGSRSRH